MTEATGAQGLSVKAAEYVRMSTEHQKYSTENQAEIIRRFAGDRGFEIVRTYADHGKSGLRLDGRDALKQLIDDVRSGRADFTAVLVYDVSRWGRFQDADESAYYEYLCKEAGIIVHYCAEQFENDGSLSATIIKSMKRAMAGEYSRELSAKVFTGQCRLITLGFRQGGLAGYGLRRQLIDEHRTPKGELAIGVQKSIQTDRVVLVQGPIDEVETVRRMYRLFLEDHSEQQIADLLNREDRTTDLKRPWTRGTVHQVLTNEKYIGNNLYNRTSFKLKKNRVSNPPDMWVRAEGAFPGVVNQAVYGTVQQIIAERSKRYSDQDMLGRLSVLLQNVGRLSALVIDEQDDLPSSSAYRCRFGSLLRAYELVGYNPERDFRYVEVNRALRAMHPHVVADAVASIRSGGGEVDVDPTTDLLTVNGEFTTSVVISRCVELPSGARRWTIRLDASLRPDITVAVRMDLANQSALDYYLLPRLGVPAGPLRLRDENGLDLDSFRYDSLEPFFYLASRTAIGRVA
ncbi:MAG: serine recombinase [Acidobacteria bacterium SCN 69-37]|nr:MAG: serine recombinase [Acidobacteria bacterium SCN 69-37]